MDENVSGVPFFSIIMPAYGVQKYIKKAMESIRSQTYGNWELIIVDDCSPDQCGSIAEGYANGDERIKVIHHEVNKGLSAARNTGEKAALGTYIWFMDTDDYVDADLLEQVYRSLQKNAAQLVVFGLLEEYFKRDGTLDYVHKVYPKEGYYVNAQELRKEIIYLEQATLYGYAWNKFYDLAYLRGLRLKYEDVKLIEDIIFNVKYCMDIERMNTLAITPYHYAKRLDGSLTNKFVPDYYELHRERIQILYNQYKYWKLVTPEVSEILGSLYGRYIFSALQRNCDRRTKMTHGERYKWCREVFAEGLFNELIPAARAKKSKALRILLLLLRWKKVMACLMLGRFIYVVRMKLPMWYSGIKSGR